MNSTNLIALWSEHPTLLTVPNADHRYDWPTTTRVLPLPTWAYVVSEDGGTWSVRVVETGESAYAGPGPVHIAMSRVPF